MISYIKILIQFSFIIFKIFIFSYLFHPLYKRCNIQEKIKKDGKKKIIYKPKSILAFIYFILLFILFKLFTLKVILFIFIGCILGFLIGYDYFSPELNNKLDKLNRFPLVILLWKLFHSIFTVIFICTNPINKILNNFVNKRYIELKKLFNLLINLESDSFSDKDIKKINKQLGLKNNEEFSKLSSISQYLVNSTQNKKDNKILPKIKILKTINETESFNENINELNNDFIENDLKYKNSSSIIYKEKLTEKLNNINNIFSKDSISEIEDITITHNN